MHVSIHPHLTLPLKFETVDVSHFETLASILLPHRVMASKLHAPYLVPAKYTIPEQPCRHPWSATSISLPHRCTACVTQLDMAWFDMDQDVTPESLEVTLTRLKKQSVQYIIYSTASHNPQGSGKYAYRVVLPLAFPVSAYEWPSVREYLIHLFAIRADLKTSKSVAHGYFLPSKLPYINSPPETYISNNEAKPLVAPTIKSKVVSRVAPPKATTEQTLKDYLVARGTDLPVTLVRALRAEPLAEDGRRERGLYAAVCAAGLTAQEAGIAITEEDVVELLLPSVHAMQALGSKRNERELRDKVKRFFQRAYGK